MGKRKRTMSDRSMTSAAVQRQAQGFPASARKNSRPLCVSEDVNERDEPGQDITRTAMSKAMIANGSLKDCSSFDVEFKALPSMGSRDIWTAFSNALTKATRDLQEAPEWNFVACLKRTIWPQSKKPRKHASGPPRLSQVDGPVLSKEGSKVSSAQGDEAPLPNSQTTLSWGHPVFSCSTEDIRFGFEPDPDCSPPTWPNCEQEPKISHIPPEIPEPHYIPDNWGWDDPPPPNFLTKHQDDMINDWTQSLPSQLCDSVSEPQQEMPLERPSRRRPTHGTQIWTLPNILNEGGERPKRSPSLVSESRVKQQPLKIICQDGKEHFVPPTRPPWESSPRWSYVYHVAGLRDGSVLAQQVEMMEQRKDFIRAHKSMARREQEKRDWAKAKAQETLYYEKERLDATLIDVRRLFFVDGEENYGADEDIEERRMARILDEWEACHSSPPRRSPEDPLDPARYLSRNRYRKEGRKRKRKSRGKCE